MKRQELKTYLVIPTIRDLKFLKIWGNKFKNCHLIVVEDSRKTTVEIPNKNFLSITHYCWKDIDHDLGSKSWIISRHNAGIRSYGFLKAYEMGADVVITIDDDCYPIEDNFIKQHISNLKSMAPNAWFSTYPNSKWMFTRGFPYDVRNSYPVGVSHGIWSGALDLDAKTEIKLPKLLSENPYPPSTVFIPFNYFYPMCSMNLAFSKEMTPLMFFPMMGFDNNGKSWGFDRYDDIWAGIFSKKIMDHLNIAVVSGSPQVDHKKASLTTHNKIKEYKGMKYNELIWKAVNEVKLTKKNPRDCYIELAEKVVFPRKLYFGKLKKAMIIWANLF